MSLFSSIGKALKGVGKAAIGGVGGLIKPLVGSSPLDEIGTVGGFLLGGPAGAAAGRGIGKGLATGNIGKALGGAAEGYALGTGANVALGGLGGGLKGAMGELNSALRPLSGAARTATGALGGGSPTGAAVNAAANAAGGGGTRPGGIGGALGTIASTLGGGNGAENQLRALGLLGSAGGAYLAGRSEDQTNKFNQDQITYARERNATFDPVRQQLLQTLIGRLGGGSLPTSATGGGSTSSPTPVGSGTQAPLSPPGPRTGQGMATTPRPLPISREAEGMGPNINPVSTTRPTFLPPPQRTGGESPMGKPGRLPGGEMPGISPAGPGQGILPIGGGLTQGWEGMNTPQRFPMPETPRSPAPLNPSYIDEGPRTSPMAPSPPERFTPIEPAPAPPPPLGTGGGMPFGGGMAPIPTPTFSSPGLQPSGMTSEAGGEEDPYDPYDLFGTGRRRKPMTSSVL